MDADEDYEEMSDDVLSNREEMSGADYAWEVLGKVEHQMAYSSDKAMNLEMFLIQVEDVASDFAAFGRNDGEFSAEALGVAFEFDVLSGILSSEVVELGSLVSSLEADVMDAEQRLSESTVSEDLLLDITEQLHEAQKSLKMTHDMVADIRARSAKFENDLALAGFGTRTRVDSQSSAHSPKEEKEEERYFLQMLEKSIARELDLEKKLSESRHNEGELERKLLCREQETYSLEESMELVLQRVFEAENAAETLFGISRELSGKLQIVQFNLRGSVLREGKMRSMLEEDTLKLSAEGFASDKSRPIEVVEGDGCSLNTSEVAILRDKVSDLEEQLRESESQLKVAMASISSSCEEKERLQIELLEMQNIVEGLKEDVLRFESRAESAEEKCVELTKTNFELGDQMRFLSSNETEKADILERRLKESDTQLEHAKASVEAIEEQQNMLYSALGDMEHLIADLKAKVSKAESRAENAESKCGLLTDTNLELNEECGFLRNRLECMEASLSQAEDMRIVSAKDIGIRTKFITDLVLKLAMERERLQLQISTLTKQNKVLAKKCLKTKDSASSTASQKASILPAEATVVSASTETQAEQSAAATAGHDTTADTAVSREEGSLGVEPILETVRTIEATQLNIKYLLMAVLVLIVSIFAIYLFQLES